MNKLLEEGHDLLSKNQFIEAEKCFSKAAKDQSLREEALGALVDIAQKQKNYDKSTKILENFILEFPHRLDAKANYMHLFLRRDSLEEYRVKLRELMASEVEDKSLPNVKTGRKLLRNVQYAGCGKSRLDFLSILAQSTRLAISERANSHFELSLFEAECHLALGDYERFAQIVSGFVNEKKRSWKFNALKKIVTKYELSVFPDYSAPLLFGIGLSRTGTSSLNAALNILGMHSIHWTNPHTSNLITDKDFFLFDGFTDISVSYQFEKLFKKFPNAKFIYTTRKIDSWVKSIKVHYSNNREVSKPSDLNDSNNADRYDGLGGEIESSLYSNFATWRSAHEAFDKRVNEFFRNKPERLLKMNICEGEEWERLCAFLDKPIPETPFPNTNQSPVHKNP